MQFDKAGIKLLNADIAEALKAVADKHGVTVEVRGGTYDPSGSFKPKVVFTAADHAQVEYERDASLLGLAPDSFGHTFKSGARTFTIAGLNLRARKRPVICTGDDGKTYSFEVRGVPAEIRDTFRGGTYTPGKDRADA